MIDVREEKRDNFDVCGITIFPTDILLGSELHTEVVFPYSK